MSTQKVSDRFQKAVQELRKQPILIIGMTLIWGFLVRTQDMVSVAGPILSAMATTLLLAHLFQRGALPLRPLLALGVIVFPLNALWTVMLSLFQNTTWTEAFSSAWAIPLLFVMTFGLAVLTHTSRAITLEKVGLDQGLKLGWLRTCMDAKALVWTLFYITAVAVAALAFHGLFFILFAPLGLALLKVSADSYSSEAGVRT